jgi:hypothetical protein
MAQTIQRMEKDTESGINALHKDYRKLSPIWKQIRAVMFGKAAIVELKTELSLPLPDYTDTIRGTVNRDALKIAQRVRTYLRRGQLLNATARTQASNTGMIWSKEPEDSIPTQMEYVRETLRDNVQKIVSDVASIGRYFVLLDSDGIDSVTQAEQAQGIGVPQWILYEAERIIYWRDGEIRLTEVVEERLNELDYEEVEQVRRLVLIDGVYHNQVWREGELFTDTIPTLNGSSLDYIPGQFFGAEDNSMAATKPPIYDLAEANIGHFMLDCDNRDNLHAHGQGLTNIFVDDPEEFSTANPNGLNTGAKGVNQFGKDDRVEVVQIDATGAIAAEMLRDQERMIMIGAQLVQDTGGNQTLGAKKMEHGASISTLKQIALNVSEGVTNLLNMQAEMTGVSADIFYELNTQFITDDMDAQKLLAHMQLVQFGALPRSTLFESARKAQLTTLTDEEMEQELGEQAFSSGGVSQEEAARMAEQEGE